MNHFAKNLRILREQKGLKQSDMQSEIGFPQSTWNNYERGKSKPAFDDLIKIAQYFDIAESDIIHTDFSYPDLLQKAKRRLTTPYPDLKPDPLTHPNEAQIQYDNKSITKGEGATTAHMLQDIQRLMHTQEQHQKAANGAILALLRNILEQDKGKSN